MISKNDIKKIAKENLIDEIRFIDALEYEPKEIFQGRMPRDIMPEAKSVIVTLIYIGSVELKGFDDLKHARISKLALSGFYSNIVRPMKGIYNYLLDNGHKAKIVDGEESEETISLKGVAVKAGLGWIGRNALLINKDYGSFIALGAIITDADLAEKNINKELSCPVNCHECQKACPTLANKSDKVLDRPNCISDYLESADVILNQGVNLDNYFYECDICQLVCPYNLKQIQKPLKTPFGDFFESLNVMADEFSFDRLLNITEEEYEKEILKYFYGFELPYEMFKRNIKMTYAGVSERISKG